jgi:hypothetical protein
LKSVLLVSDFLSRSRNSITSCVDIWLSSVDEVAEPNLEEGS